MRFEDAAVDGWNAQIAVVPNGVANRSNRPLSRPLPGALLYQARSLDEYGAILAAIFNTHAARKSDKIPWRPSQR